LGPVASGRAASEDEHVRQEFSQRHGTKIFDVELDAVVESVYGNRKEQYALIRGAADYGNGQAASKGWQLYSALMAASVLRAIVEEMPEYES